MSAYDPKRVFAGLVGILLCAMLGGMRAVTWTQIAQYIVLIIAYLTPILFASGCASVGQLSMAFGGVSDASR
jgi:Na+(H+)/acetate symporter ActP